MNYKSYDDEALRRILLTDPDDTLAICEAAERFSKQPHEDCAEDIAHEFNMAVECPNCNHGWEECVDVLDYLPNIL